jgi:hypothetical protein
MRCSVASDPGKVQQMVSSLSDMLQEKHQEKKKNLYYAFVDLVKAFDRVPRSYTVGNEEVWCRGVVGICRDGNV